MPAFITTSARNRMVARAHEPGRRGIAIEGTHLILLGRVVRRPGATDAEIDKAVREAREAGHTWAEIEPVLHLFLAAAE